MPSSIEKIDWSIKSEKQKKISAAYLRQAPRPPEKANFPKTFGYIHYKAFSYLAQGPEEYRENDFFNLPPKEFSADRLEILKLGCQQILEWRGSTPETALEGLELSGFCELLMLFHFKLKHQSTISDRDPTVLEKMEMMHVMTSEEITLYNRVKVQTQYCKNYRHSETGIVFPEEIGKLQIGQVCNYELNHPGLGISIGYNGEGIKATVYLYNMGLKSVPNDINSVALHKQFEQSIQDIFRLGEMGMYQNVKVVSKDVIELREDLQALHAIFNYYSERALRISHLYFSGFNNHYLKVRFSFDQKLSEDAEAVQESFLSSLLELMN